MNALRTRTATVGVALVSCIALMASEALAATYFTYTVDFKYRLQGRNMSGHTDYCNNFTATFHEAGFDPNITIQLKENVSFGTDPGFATVSYPTNGGTYGYCWRGFVASKTYYFMYVKGNNTKSVRGNGSVTD
jgi:hypothetical protein